MSSRPDLETRLIPWLDEQAPSLEPDGLLDRVSADLADTRRLPGWVLLERWIPMQTRARFGTASRAVVILALLGLLLASIAAIGVASQSGPDPAPPFGLARNGLVAFGVDGDIWVVEPDGSGPRSLVASSDLEMPAGWSPDGTRLAYWNVPFDGDLSDQASIDAAFEAYNSGQDRRMSVKVIGVDGADPQTIIDGIVWTQDCGTDVGWAPDSRQLAIAHQIADGTIRIPVIDIVGLGDTEPRRLVEQGMDPSWSPDGSTIAFHAPSHTKDGTFQPSGVRLIGADGSDLRQLSTVVGSGCAFDGPAWSPDSTKVAFYNGHDGLHNVWVADVNTGQNEQIAGELADEYWPRWSPDGTRLAFDRVVDAEHNEPQFVLSDPDGGNQVMLDHPPVVGRYPTWSPDGRYLLGMLPSADHADAAALLLVDTTDASEPVELYRAATRLWGGDPSWQRLAP